jgi:hypothetical protein
VDQRIHPRFAEPFDERARVLLEGFSATRRVPARLIGHHFDAWARSWREQPEDALRQHQNVHAFELDIIAAALRGPKTK